MAPAETDRIFLFYAGCHFYSTQLALIMGPLLSLFGMSDDAIRSLDMRSKATLNKFGVDRDILIGSIPIFCCWCLYWGKGVSTFIIVATLLFTLGASGYIQTNGELPKTGSKFIDADEAEAWAAEDAAAATVGGAAGAAANDDDDDAAGGDDDETKKGQ